MNVYTEMNGGTGDLLLYMMKPVSDFGHFADLKAAGHKTMVQVTANSDASIDLFRNINHLDYLRFASPTMRVDQKPPGEPFAKFDKIRRHGANWYQPTLFLDSEDMNIVAEVATEPFIAFHPFATAANRVPPNMLKLIDMLCENHHHVRLLGSATDTLNSGEMDYYSHPNLTDMRGRTSLRAALTITKLASKFIGTLSCMNCAAALAKVPSFVIVNRAIKDPGIYQIMGANGARVEPWNAIDNPKHIDHIYAEAAAWAGSRL